MNIPKHDLERWLAIASGLRASAEALRQEITEHVNGSTDGMLLRIAIGDAVIGTGETVHELKRLLTTTPAFAARLAEKLHDDNPHDPIEVAR